jgi:hypothetical protein
MNPDILAGIVLNCREFLTNRGSSRGFLFLQLRSLAVAVIGHRVRQAPPLVMRLIKGRREV